MSTTQPASPDEIEYPDSDGEPRADNTLQWHWVTLIEGGLEVVFARDPNVFVAGDLFWYPVEGDNTTRLAPDVLVAFGRPKGDRGSYMQWREAGIAPQVVFEVLSPSNRAEMTRKFQFYETYGAEEYYIYDPDDYTLEGWLRRDGTLRKIPAMNGWTSPRLGVRFELVNNQLRLFGPDEQPFMTFVEYANQKEEHRRRADEFRRQADEHRRRADEFRRQADEHRRRAEEVRRQANEFRRRGDELQKQAEEQYRRADELQQQTDEQHRRADEQVRRADELQQQADEQRRGTEEQRRRVDKLQQQADEERRLADEQVRRADELQWQVDEHRRRADELQQKADEQRRYVVVDRRRDDEQRRRADRLAAQLKALGIEPEL